MDYLLSSFSAAWGLLSSLDREIYFVVWTSVWISLSACLVATILAVPAGLWIGLGRFRGRAGIVLVLNTLMALPTVVVGLTVYGLLSRRGPLGDLGLLFTPMGVILGEIVLAWPIIANLTRSAVEGLDPRLLPTCQTLGASPLQQAAMVLREGRLGITAAVVAGFGRVIAEVGVAMMLGGNIKWYTRTMTTAIALETSKGEFVLGLALGMVLLTVALLVNAALFGLQRRRS